MFVEDIFTLSTEHLVEKTKTFVETTCQIQTIDEGNL